MAANCAPLLVCLDPSAARRSRPAAVPRGRLPRGESTRPDLLVADRSACLSRRRVSERRFAQSLGRARLPRSWAANGRRSSNAGQLEETLQLRLPADQEQLAAVLGAQPFRKQDRPKTASNP